MVQHFLIWGGAQAGSFAAGFECGCWSDGGDRGIAVVAVVVMRRVRRRVPLNERILIYDLI